MGVFCRKKQIKKWEKLFQRIDRTENLAYNSRMTKIYVTTSKTWLWILRFALICASMATIVFIFSNSLKDAEQSSEQSSNVLKMVQRIAMVIAPNSQLANATGPFYDWLHSSLRSIAHFLEFFLLGTLCACACYTYTFSKAWQTCPVGIVATVAVIDESLQLTATARAFEWTDILLDLSGGIVGVGLVILCVWAGGCLYRKRRAKIEKAGKRTE